MSMAAKRAGFTLIEILIVVVLIGSRAAVAIPRYTGSKERAYSAAMKADIHIAAIRTLIRRSRQLRSAL